MKGTLTRKVDPEIEGKYPLRTRSITGTFDKPPTEGKPFKICNDEPLDDPVANVRVVWTSPVVRTPGRFSDRIEFDTESGSTYCLEVHDDA